MRHRVVRLKFTDISMEVVAFTFRVEVSQRRDQQEAGGKQGVSPKRQLITTGLYGPTVQDIVLVTVTDLNTDDSGYHVHSHTHGDEPFLRSRQLFSSQELPRTLRNPKVH
jgi:hypothetical protein